MVVVELRGICLIGGGARVGMGGDWGVNQKLLIFCTCVYCVYVVYFAKGFFALVSVGG